MYHWPAVPASMFGLERSAWNYVPGSTTTVYKGWRSCRLQLYVEMAIAAAIEADSELPVVLTRIEIEKVLVLQPAIEFELQTRLERQVAGMMMFQVHSRRKGTKGDWMLHASGTLRAGGIAMPVEKFDASQRDAFEQRSTRYLDGPEFYRLHKERGNQWGPCFQGVNRVWQGQGEALSEVTVPAGIERDLSHYLFHPALSDTSGQVLTATISLEKSDGPRGGAFVGAGIEEVRVYRWPEGRHFYAHAQLRRNEAAPDNTLVGDVKVFDFFGNLITETVGARLWYLDSVQKQRCACIGGRLVIRASMDDQGNNRRN